MADDDATNLVDGDDTDTSTEADDTGVDNENEQFDENGELIVPPEEDEEVDLDGLKLKVPKTEAQKVKDAFLRQADYTRKTQEVAKEREALAAERNQFHQSTQAEITALAQVRAIDGQLADYSRIDWQAWNEQAAQSAAQGNPQEQARVNAAWMEYQQLKDGRANAANQFVGLRQQRTLGAQQEIAKRVQETSATLAKEIPDWSPDLEAKLTTYGKQTFGFSDDEIADIKIDPRIAKVLHAAFKGSQGAQTTAKVASIQKQQQVKPAETVTGKSAPVAPLSDKAPTDAWMKARNKQVAAKR